MKPEKLLKLSDILIVASIIFILLSIILKVQGKSTVDPADMLIANITPDAFLRGANSVLLLSIAIFLRDIVRRKKDE